MKLPEGIQQHPWRLLLFALLAVGLVITAWRLTAPAVLDPGPPEKLVLGVAESMLMMPVIVAEEMGFLRSAGLDVTYKRFPSGKAALQAMFRGEVDVATVAETPIVLASVQRRDFVVVGSFVSSDGDSKLLAHPASGIQVASDLRGRRVGVIAGTTAQFCLDVLLTDHGLRSTDVVPVPLSGAEMAAALRDRRVDAIAAFEPFLSEARAALGNAGRVLLDRDRCLSNASYVSFRDYPSQHKEALVRLLRGTGLAIEWMRSHRAEAIAIVARRRNTDPAGIDALWDTYRPSLELHQGYLVSLEQQAQWAMRSGHAPAGAMPNYLDFIDFSALAAVKPAAMTVIH